MAQLLIDFDWWRDPKRYRVVDVPLPKGRLVPIPLGFRVRPDAWERARGSAQLIRRRGGELEPYRPVDRWPDLFKVFASIATTPEGVLDFIERYGPLTQAGLDPRKGDDVSVVMAHAETMADLLVDVSEGDTDLIVGSQGLPLTDIEVALVMDPASKMPRLEMVPKSLLSALWMQFGQSISPGANIRRCQHCRALFEAGVGTGRRKDAKFCSDEHRITFNSLKRTNREE